MTPIDFAVLGVAQAVPPEHRRLFTQLRDAGWRSGTVLPEIVIAVDAPPIAVAGSPATAVAVERWGAVTTVLLEIDADVCDQVPGWWEIRLDGQRLTALTTGTHSGAGGALTDVAAI